MAENTSSFKTGEIKTATFMDPGIVDTHDEDYLASKEPGNIWITKLLLQYCVL